MASIAAKDSSLTHALCEAPQDEALRVLRGHPEFRAKYDEYLAQFGDRCLEELKLESETLHENPRVLMRSVGELARAPQVARQQAATGDSARDAKLQMRIALRGRPLRTLIAMGVLRKASATVTQRENLRFERTRLFARVRRIFSESGKRLSAVGVLDGADDVFYLQVEEVRAYVNGNAVTADLRGLVALRRAEFERYRQSDPPAARFETVGAVYHAQSYRAKTTTAHEGGDANERRGIGCCPGIVRGVVCVIHDPRNARLPAGSVLVADHTDPGWIMLFPSASGLLVERGSLLSHSAIVARELGIPAVVSIPGLTEWLRNGDIVELDGARGTVRRIEAEEPHA
jgi:pyruvate,water dikinase